LTRLGRPAPSRDAAAEGTECFALALLLAHPATDLRYVDSINLRLYSVFSVRRKQYASA